MKNRVLVVGPSSNKSNGGMAAVIEDIRVSKIINKEYEVRTYASFIDGPKLMRFLYSVVALIRFLFIVHSFDLIHIHTASYNSTFRKIMYLNIAKMAGKKTIVHVHGAEYLKFYAKLVGRQKSKVKKFLTEANLVVVLSEYWKREFENVFDLDNCKVLNNGIDVEYYRKAWSDCEETKNVFLVLGRVGKRKGSYDLVNAVAYAKNMNPDFCVYMAGDGEIKRINRLIAEKGLDNNIKVVGWVEGEQKLDLLKKVSTLVLPSYNEGLPMAILEAMAAGKAIISTYVGAIPEVIGQDNGYLIRPGDVAALAEAMINCSSDTNRLADFQRENVKKVRNLFSVQNMHFKLVDYYKDVLVN